jgi:pilus assembly protein Flp/PilA
MVLGRNLRHRIRWPDDPERGATAVEYGMLVALIAAVCIATVILLGGVVLDLFESAKWW